MSGTIVAFDQEAGWAEVQMENGTICRVPLNALGNEGAPHPSSYYDPSGPSPPSSPRNQAHINTFPPPPKSGHVYAVSVPCVGEKQTNPGTYTLITIPLSHDIFFERPVPVSTAIGFPLVVYKTYSLPTVSTPKSLLENGIATTLNIEPSTGKAPAEWQSRVGGIIVARKDMQSLDIRHFEGVWMHIEMIGHKFKLEGATEAGLRAKGHLTKKDLVHWWKLYEIQARG
jgi:hypothetical protein